MDNTWGLRWSRRSQSHSCIIGRVLGRCGILGVIRVQAVLSSGTSVDVEDLGIAAAAERGVETMCSVLPTAAAE